jgi:hypothetical protein
MKNHLPAWPSIRQQIQLDNIPTTTRAVHHRSLKVFSLDKHIKLSLVKARGESMYPLADKYVTAKPMARCTEDPRPTHFPVSSAYPLLSS